MNLKQRLQRLIAGQANIVKDVGDIIVGDGQQTVRLKNPNVGGASDGFALVLDSTQPTGVVWSPATGVAGIMNVTGSDGVTVTTPVVGVRNATNDLVTGTPVAQVDAQSAGNIDLDAANNWSATGGEIALASADAVDVTGAGAVTIESTGNNVDVEANVNIILNSGGTLDIDAGTNITVNTPGNFNVTTNAGDIALGSSGGGDINLDTVGTGDLNATINHDEIHTVGRNFTVNAAGTLGINLDASGGDVSIQAEQTNVIIRAGNVGGTGVVQLQPGTTSATRKFKIFNGAGAGQQTVLAASGGTVQDLEARAAINDLLDALYNWGWLSQPNP